MKIYIVTWNYNTPFNNYTKTYTFKTNDEALEKVRALHIEAVADLADFYGGNAEVEDDYEDGDCCFAAYLADDSEYCYNVEIHEQEI